MARQCTICTHPEKQAIEAAIVSNGGYQRIATRFSTGETSFSESAVRRHKANCMRAAIQSVKREQAEQTAQVAEQAEEKREQFVWDIFTQMEWLHRQVRLVYEEARAEKDHVSSLKALGEVRQQAKLFSELLAGQEPGQAEKLEAEWIAVREAIFRALEPFPEALLAVAEALFALGRGDDHESSQHYLQATTPEDSSQSGWNNP